MQPGDLIAGRFRLEAHAGAGAMGVVFRARDLAAHGRLVAVKALRQTSEAPTTRFMREAAALEQRRDGVLVEHIAHGLSEAGEPYLALEWIDGPTLAQRLQERGLTPLEALRLGARVLGGLRALHAHGIVHRDLKPSNLMLPGDDVHQVRILDLGIARFADASVELTVEGSQLGTARYMAPEQIRDPRSVDGRADVFALGCILFECLTGVAAFPGDDPVAVLAQILFSHASEPSELRPELPEDLDHLLARLLLRSPQLRPAADSALEAQLAALLEGPCAERLRALPARALSRTAPSTHNPLARTESELSHVRPSRPPLLAPARTRPHGWLEQAPSRPLIGRERELAQLTSWLTQGEPITLWGGAGIGKTRLALALAQLAAATGRLEPSAILWCDLSAARDSRDVVSVCAQQLGLSNVGQADAEEQAGRLFAKLGTMLIILDRAEHLRRELAPLIALWAGHAPDLRILVTSRVRLSSTRELALEPLAHHAPATWTRSATESTESLPLSAAAKLVLALAREAGPLPDESQLRRHAEAIAAQLDGNPLAIELALARLPLLGFSGILERLSEQLGLLGEHTGATTMRKALAWSWQLLDGTERSAFMQCSVFMAPFTLQAAEAVLVLPDGSATLDVVQSLREQSLLSARTDGAGVARLALPAVVRELAREQLMAAAAHDATLALVWERHASHALRSPGAPLEDLIAAVEHSLDESTPDLPRALALVRALERPLLAAGSGSRLAELLERVITRCEARPHETSGATAAWLEAYLLRARLLAPAGQLTRAEADLQHVLERATPLDEPALMASALLDLGVVRHFARDLDAASDCYERALAALEALETQPDPVAEARCHGNLGAVQHDRAELFLAAEGYRRALALLPERGQERLVANFQGNLALVEHELGDKPAARRLYTEAAARLEQLLDVRLLGIVLGNFGSLALTEGEHGEALEHFTRAAALLEQSGDRRSEGLSLARLAAGLALTGHVPEAEQRAAQAERLLRKDPVGRGVVALASAFIDLQAAERAREHGTPALVERHLTRARAKCASAAALRERSDDLRLYLSLLEPRLARALDDAGERSVS